MPNIDISGNKEYNLRLEHDLQAIIVDYLRQTDLLFCASLGGYLDSPSKRIRSWIEGYEKRNPDLLIYSPSGDGKYKGLALELRCLSSPPIRQSVIVANRAERKEDTTVCRRAVK